MANAIRALAMDAVEAARSGHPAMPMGMADVATVLWTRFLTFDPEKPDWPDRDRFVLSAGHGSMLLYALLHLSGYEQMTLDELKRFRQLGSRTPGHPEHGLAAGVENHHRTARPAMASRQASEGALEVLTKAAPNLIAGSADLSGSNNTKTEATKAITPGDFSGRYIHYGVREHAMAAIMNGIALHKGLVPFGGTFLVFSDYARNAIRLSALMGLRVIYVTTHDSIGLGEDGPTHQPIEHLASLRAIPGLHVLRPADAVETAECWALALTRKEGPSVIALSRQSLPPVRESGRGDHRSDGLPDP